MKRKNLKRIAKAKFLAKKAKLFFVVLLETIMCFICYSFLAAMALIMIYYTIMLIRDDEVIKRYVLGILVMSAVGLSLGYISMYNKKYKKNDSNSSKRQNDFFFEADIRREERRYSDRRNLE